MVIIEQWGRVNIIDNMIARLHGNVKKTASVRSDYYILSPSQAVTEMAMVQSETQNVSTT